MHVKKAHVRSPRRIRTSHTCVRRPTWSGRPTPSSTSPVRPAANTLAFSSIVVKLVSGRRLRRVPHAATVSAKATQTPPWT